MRPNRVVSQRGKIRSPYGDVFCRPAWTASTRTVIWWTALFPGIC